MKMNLEKHSTPGVQHPAAPVDGRRGHWMLDVRRLPFCGGVLLAMLASGTLADAQTNAVPGPGDYASFSRFISDRNIFDPSRYPRSSSKHPSHHAPASRSAPTFTLVGVMNYPKGLFAFFDGNSSDLRKVLYESDTNSIAGYTVAEITLSGVKLQTADKKQTVQLKIGEMMRQVGNDWEPAGQSDLPASTADNTAPAAENSGSGTGSAPASAGAPNDILKKLMEQREKELK
jgi:hypothetical protein